MEKNAVITGSSRGIGRAIASAFAEKGWGVCINYIERQDLAEELRDQIIAKGGRAIAVRADVADKEQVDEMFKKAQEELGPISLLVNNAGISCHKQFQDIDMETWRRIFDVNVFGCVNCVNAALPYMLHEHEGIIINMSSIWGHHGGSCESVYTASKHAIIGLTRSLSAELAPSHIRVNAISPGVVETDMMRKELSEEELEGLKWEIPLERFGSTEDVAKAALYIAEAGYMTGQTIVLDGGYMI